MSDPNAKLRRLRDAMLDCVKHWRPHEGIDGGYWQGRIWTAEYTVQQIDRLLAEPEPEKPEPPKLGDTLYMPRIVKSQAPRRETLETPGDRNALPLGGAGLVSSPETGHRDAQETSQLDDRGAADRPTLPGGEQRPAGHTSPLGDSLEAQVGPVQQGVDRLCFDWRCALGHAQTCSGFAQKNPAAP